MTCVMQHGETCGPSQLNWGSDALKPTAVSWVWVTWVDGRTLPAAGSAAAVAGNNQQGAGARSSEEEAIWRLWVHIKLQGGRAFQNVSSTSIIRRMLVSCWLMCWLERLFDSSLGSDYQRWQKDMTGRRWSGTWKGGGHFGWQTCWVWQHTLRASLRLLCQPRWKSLWDVFTLWPEFKLRKSCCFLLFLQRNCICCTSFKLLWWHLRYMMTCIYFP